MKIRFATLEDLPILLKFEQELIDHERPLEPALKPEGEIHYYDLAELIVSDGSKVFVAEVDGQIVGSGFGKIEENKPKYIEPRHGYIGFIFVKEAFRRQGIAETILETLIEWFKENDVFEARLRVYSGNDAAIKAYEKKGFSSGLIEMRKSLR